MGISMKTTSGKILASVALVGTAAAVAGMGTYGAFTSTTNASQSVTAGTVVIALGTDAANTLTVPVAGFLPGDSVEKFATLTNSGDSAFNTVSLTTTAAAPASVLTTDTTNGLRITIDSCTEAWTAVAGGADTCPGTAKNVVSDSAIIVANKALAAPTSLTAGSKDFLKITTALPAAAGDTFQGKTSTVTFTFDATQRTGTVK